MFHGADWESANGRGGVEVSSGANDSGKSPLRRRKEEMERKGMRGEVRLN